MAAEADRSLMPIAPIVNLAGGKGGGRSAHNHDASAPQGIDEHPAYLLLQLTVSLCVIFPSDVQAGLIVTTEQYGAI